MLRWVERRNPSNRIDLELEEPEIVFKEILGFLHSTTSNSGTGSIESMESK
jgi:hypothetical protein